MHCAHYYSINNPYIIVDIPECDLGLDNCHADANCIELPGSFDCECKPGHGGNGLQCPG